MALICFIYSCRSKKTLTFFQCLHNICFVGWNIFCSRLSVDCVWTVIAIGRASWAAIGTAPRSILSHKYAVLWWCGVPLSVWSQYVSVILPCRFLLYYEHFYFLFCYRAAVVRCRNFFHMLWRFIRAALIGADSTVEQHSDVSFFFLAEHFAAGSVRMWITELLPYVRVPVAKCSEWCT